MSKNIVVPKGANCTLRGTKVDGNVIVKKNAKVVIKKSARIDGNVQGQGSRPVKVLGSKVFGDVQVDNGRRVIVRNAGVDGNLQCKSNNHAPVGSGNRVDGNKEGQCRGF